MSSIKSPGKKVASKEFEKALAQITSLRANNHNLLYVFKKHMPSEPEFPKAQMLSKHEKNHGVGMSVADLVETLLSDQIPQTLKEKLKSFVVTSRCGHCEDLDYDYEHNDETYLRTHEEVPNSIPQASIEKYHKTWKKYEQAIFKYRDALEKHVNSFLEKEKAKDLAELERIKNKYNLDLK